MSSADQFDKCVGIAVDSHYGQRRRCGEPAIAHAMRVAARVSDSLHDMCVAVLHDVIEDTSVTADRLRNHSVGDFVIEDIETLTRNRSESYADYIGRVCNGSESARRVKIADLYDNLRNDICGTLRSRYEKALGRLRELNDAE